MIAITSRTWMRFPTWKAKNPSYKLEKSEASVPESAEPTK